MIENQPDYGSMKNIVTSIVNAPRFLLENQRLSHLQRSRLPPMVRQLPNGKLDYEGLYKEFELYTNDTITYVNALPEEVHSRENNTTNLETFSTHRTIMKLYFKELYKYKGFRKLLEGKPLEFMYWLVDLHDFLRFFINGSYSLEYTERVSDGLEKWVISKVFGKSHIPEYTSYLHTVRWITGEEEIPDANTASNPQKIAEIFKYIDTISKGSNGQLIDPETIFSENGAYDKWLNYQKKQERFPMKT